MLDFFQIDSELISPLASVDLAMLVAEALIQLIGRAELRALTKSMFTAVTWKAGICKASC